MFPIFPWKKIFPPFDLHHPLNQQKKKKEERKERRAEFEAKSHLFSIAVPGRKRDRDDDDDDDDEALLLFGCWSSFVRHVG